jgi:hypothetical protein
MPLNSSTPLYGMELTEQVSSLLAKKFRAILQNDSTLILPSPAIPTQLVVDCERAAKILAAAYKCQCKSTGLPSNSLIYKVCSQDNLGCGEVLRPA